MCSATRVGWVRQLLVHLTSDCDCCTAPSTKPPQEISHGDTCITNAHTQAQGQWCVTHTRTQCTHSDARDIVSTRVAQVSLAKSSDLSDRPF